MIKYIFKYIYKGGDHTTLEIDCNEIKSYIDGQYIAAPESAWRIFQFETHEQTPNVVCLAVHLPGHHIVVYDPNDDPATILQHGSQAKTMLTEFFAICAVSDKAARYTYQEFPQYFMWRNNSKMWVKRQPNSFALGCMYFVAPTAEEQFYLRLLLTIIRGPKSFEHLRTYNGHCYPTFWDACIACGLLENDEEWRRCLTEASTMQTGSCLRSLFASILMFGCPNELGQLWYQFRTFVCDDLRRRFQRQGIGNPSKDDIYDYGLFLLNQTLIQSGKTLADFPSMPQLQHNWGSLHENPLIAEQLNYNPDTEQVHAENNISQLNEDQRDAFNQIMESIDNRLGRIFFLDGAGSCGKTFVYKTIAHKVRSQHKIVICVASSGIASLLLPGGRTAHSTFKIPIDGLAEDSICSIPKEGSWAQLLRITAAIIWDEALMQHHHTHEALDCILRDICSSPLLFGGITIIFGGDFQQILPVISKGTRGDIVSASLRHSLLWSKVAVLHLQRNMRLEPGSDEEDFAKWLLDIGHGWTNDHNDKVLLPPHMLCNSEQVLIDTVYPGLSTLTPPPEYFLDSIILAPRNSHVEDLNLKILQQMSGRCETFYSVDTIIHEPGADGPTTPPANSYIPPEFLRSINGSGLPPGELSLKAGCPLILLNNLALTRDLCNGTRLILRQWTRRVLEVQIIGGNHHGEIALIPRITLKPSGRAA